MMLNTRPIGLVFKQHPRDPANVNAWKNMCDPYILFLLLVDIMFNGARLIVQYKLGAIWGKVLWNYF